MLNGGAVMWSIGQIFVRAKRDVPALKPDYVVIYSGLNEAWNTLLLAREGVSMEQLVKQGRFGIFTKNLAQASWIEREIFSFKLYEMYMQPTIRDLLSLARGSKAMDYPSGPVPFILDNYLHVLRELLQYLKESGVKPVFVVQITGDPTPMNSYLTTYSHAGARVAAEMGAIVIDPSPILEGNPGGPKSLFAGTGVHYSEPGARKLASFLFERLFVGQTSP